MDISYERSIGMDRAQVYELFRVAELANDIEAAEHWQAVLDEMDGLNG